MINNINNNYPSGEASGNHLNKQQAPLLKPKFNPDANYAASPNLSAKMAQFDQAPFALKVMGLGMVMVSQLGLQNFTSKINRRLDRDRRQKQKLKHMARIVSGEILF